MNKRIGITQRVELVQSHNEKRDCLDQQWTALLETIDLIPIPIPNRSKHIAEWCEVMNLDGFILTGGNDLAHLPEAKLAVPERDNTETSILSYALAKKIPVLGICRGMQIINHFCGGSLIPVSGHVAKKHRVRATEQASLLAHFHDHEVNSFHNWGILTDNLGENLTADLVTEQWEIIEGFSHTNLPWAGVMWHPEREQPFRNGDMKLIKQLFGA